MMTIVATFEIDTHKPVNEEIRIVDYFKRELSVLEDSGILVKNVRTLNKHSKCDTNAIELTKKIFEEN